MLDCVKIDVEGLELEVFRGMEASAKSGKLQLFTFEYGNKWRTPRPGHPHGIAFKSAAARRSTCWTTGDSIRFWSA